MNKLIIVFLALVAVSVQGNAMDEEKKRLKQYSEECVEKTKVDMALVLRGRKGDFVEDKNLEDYYFCTMNKMDFVSDSGILNTQNMIAKFPDTVPREEATKIVTKCAEHDTGISKEKVAYKFYKCLIETAGNKVKLF